MAQGDTGGFISADISAIEQAKSFCKNSKSVIYYGFCIFLFCFCFTFGILFPYYFLSFLYELLINFING